MVTSGPAADARSLLARATEWDWLALFAASWVLPVLQEVFTPLTYFTSLMFWLVPSVLLLPRFLEYTDAGGRRRTALLVAIIDMVLLGCVLDLVFGARLFRFDGVPPGAYIAWIDVAALGIHIPVEELLFYAMSPIAILLVYAWADEYWLAAYSPRAARLALSGNERLLRVSPAPFIVAAIVLGAAMLLRRHVHPGVSPLPTYLAVLAVFGLIPTLSAYRSFDRFVNWRAFGLVTLYVLVTSIVWEAGLAMPRHWWGFRWDAMIGVSLPLWRAEPAWPLPIEEVGVWLAAPFSCVLTYEGVKALLYRRRPTKPSFVHPSLRTQPASDVDTAFDPV